MSALSGVVTFHDFFGAVLNRATRVMNAGAEMTNAAMAAYAFEQIDLARAASKVE